LLALYGTASKNRHECGLGSDLLTENVSLPYLLVSPILCNIHLLSLFASFPMNAKTIKIDEQKLVAH
jgi:hypothetical protein